VNVLPLWLTPLPVKLIAPVAVLVSVIEVTPPEEQEEFCAVYAPPDHRYATEQAVRSSRMVTLALPVADVMVEVMPPSKLQSGVTMT
jgi:hypothetical protein